MRGGFVTYLRVSTDRQGKSGLGLEAQREAVRVYLNGGKWHIIAEHVEVESGRNNARPALDAALSEARLHRVPLVVANVSRLTRSVAFLSKLIESGADVRFADMPQIEGPAGRFMLNQMVAVAELEAGMIGDRTRKALAAAKARGTKLGGFRGKHVATDAAREAGRAAATARATARSADLAPVIAGLREAGVTSASGIAKALNERGIPTARGGIWQATQVQRVLARMPA